VIHLTFDEVRHYGSGRYAIDWERGERKYKTPCHGIAVYECGLVEVTRSGYNDPSWRRHAASQYDLRMENLSEFGGYRFATPEGVPVQKNQITAGTMFMHDYERGRVYFMPKWRGCITFLSEHAQPIAKDPVKIFVRDKRKEKELRGALDEHIALGITLCGLQGGKSIYPSRHYPPTNLKKLIVNRGGDLSDEDVQEACKSIVQFPLAFQNEVRAKCGRTMQYEYLTVKEK